MSKGTEAEKGIFWDQQVGGLSGLRDVSATQIAGALNATQRADCNQQVVRVYCVALRLLSSR